MNKKYLKLSFKPGYYCSNFEWIGGAVIMSNFSIDERLEVQVYESMKLYQEKMNSWWRRLFTRKEHKAFLDEFFDIAKFWPWNSVDVKPEMAKIKIHELFTKYELVIAKKGFLADLFQRVKIYLKAKPLNYDDVAKQDNTLRVENSGLRTQIKNLTETNEKLVARQIGTKTESMQEKTDAKAQIKELQDRIKQLELEAEAKSLNPSIEIPLPALVPVDHKHKMEEMQKTIEAQERQINALLSENKKVASLQARNAELEEEKALLETRFLEAKTSNQSAIARLQGQVDALIAEKKDRDLKLVELQSKVTVFNRMIESNPEDNVDTLKIQLQKTKQQCEEQLQVIEQLKALAEDKATAVMHAKNLLIALETYSLRADKPEQSLVLRGRLDEILKHERAKKSSEYILQTLERGIAAQVYLEEMDAPQQKSSMEKLKEVGTEWMAKLRARANTQASGDKNPEEPVQNSDNLEAGKARANSNEQNTSIVPEKPSQSAMLAKIGTWKAGFNLMKNKDKSKDYAPATQQKN